MPHTDSSRWGWGFGPLQLPDQRWWCDPSSEVCTTSMSARRDPRMRFGAAQQPGFLRESATMKRRPEGQDTRSAAAPTFGSLRTEVLVVRARNVQRVRAPLSVRLDQRLEIDRRAGPPHAEPIVMPQPPDRGDQAMVVAVRSGVRTRFWIPRDPATMPEAVAMTVTFAAA